MIRRKFLSFAFGGFLGGSFSQWACAEGTARANARDEPLMRLLLWVRETGHPYVVGPDLSLGLGLAGERPEVIRHIQMSDDDRTHMVAVERTGFRIFIAYQTTASTLAFWTTSESGALENAFERNIQTRVLVSVSNQMHFEDFEQQKRYWSAQPSPL